MFGNYTKDTELEIHEEIKKCKEYKYLITEEDIRSEIHIFPTMIASVTIYQMIVEWILFYESKIWQFFKDK